MYNSHYTLHDKIIFASSKLTLILCATQFYFFTPQAVGYMSLDFKVHYPCLV